MITLRLCYPPRLVEAAKAHTVLFLVTVGVLYPSRIPAPVSNATGTIQETVTDASGAVVPNVQIALTQPSTSQDLDVS